MTKKEITGTLTLVDASEETVADDVANGVLDGTYAKEAILAKQAVQFKDSDDKDVIIPYHSILKAVFESEDVTVEPPVDESCVEVTGRC